MTSPASPSASLPPPVRAVLDLFEGPLSDLAFPDVDRASLATAEAEVEARRATLQAALETVQAARTQLEHSQEALLTQVRRAHAYATIYAQGDEALSASLAEIKLDGRVLAPKKTRGRPRKNSTKTQTSLAVANDDAA